jgi:hypothetical protein
LLAVKALIDEGFQQLELNRVQARVATDNHRSRLVVRRLSFEMVCESLTPASVEGELGTCVRLLKPTNADVATLTSLIGHASGSIARQCIRPESVAKRCFERNGALWNYLIHISSLFEWIVLAGSGSLQWSDLYVPTLPLRLSAHR